MYLTFILEKIMNRLIIILLMVVVGGIVSGGSVDGGSGDGGSGDGELSDHILLDIAREIRREATRDTKDDETSFIHRCVIIFGVVLNIIMVMIFKIFLTTLFGTNQLSDPDAVNFLKIRIRKFSL